MLNRTTGNYILVGVLEQETYSKGHCGGLELKILFLTECFHRITYRPDTKFDFSTVSSLERESLLRLNDLTDQKKDIISPETIVRLSLNKYVFILVRLPFQIFFTSNPEYMPSV